MREGDWNLPYSARRLDHARLHRCSVEELVPFAHLKANRPPLFSKCEITQQSLLRLATGSLEDLDLIRALRSSATRIRDMQRRPLEHLGYFPFSIILSSQIINFILPVELREA